MNLAPVEEIFHHALEAPEAERSGFVQKACGGDAELHAQVLRLLEAHERSRAFLSTQPETVQLSLPTAVAEGPGARIGRYKLLQQIGEGGMGIVFMAEQEEPVRRRVALKIIKLGMDTRQVVARFEAERQALALMDHPNIARVLDGGATESGRPYFVMELVQGLPITEFCDKNKLTPRQRLELFLPVCQAIQSAHQKGIIHRDIKPSNVLVTLNHGEPVPKVIDFGIAKATNQRLTEKTLFTNYAMMIGTPAYMSPEQAEMTSLDIDTRTDVYSLGVLLYELMAGSTPFTEKRLRSVGYGEMQRIIAEENPQKPSERLSTLTAQEKTALTQTRGTDLVALGKVIKGELDWIIMKCLEKDRRRRYDTPSELAAELKRHLNHEPISAAAPSLRYRLSKFYQRNRPLVAATGSIALVLLTATAISAKLAVDATRAERARSAEAAHAKNEAAVAEAVNHFLNEDLLGQADPEKGTNPEIKVREVVDRAAQTIDARFQDQPLVQAALHEKIGTIYKNMAQAEAAEFHLKRSLSIRQDCSSASTEEIVSSMTLLGSLYLMPMRREAAARTVASNAVELASGSLARTNITLLRARFLLGEAESWSDDPGGLAILKDVFETQRKTLGDSHRETLKSLRILCFLLQRFGHRIEAEELSERTLQNALAQAGAGSREEMDLTYERGMNLFRMDRDEESKQLLKKALTLAKQLGDSLMQQKCVTSLGDLGLAEKNFDQAIAFYTEAERLSQQRFGRMHGLTVLTMCRLGDVYTATRSFELAESILTEACQIARTSESAHGAQPFAKDALASFWDARGDVQKAEAARVEALAYRIRNRWPWGESHPSLQQIIAATGSEEQAWKALDELVKNHPEELNSWYLYSGFALGFGRTAEYERLVREMLSRFPGRGQYVFDELPLKAALMSESCLTTYERAKLEQIAARLAGRVRNDAALGSNGAGGAFANNAVPQVGVTLALYQYRAGHYAQALEWLSTVDQDAFLKRTSVYALALTLEAMCQCALGHSDAMREAWSRHLSAPATRNIESRGALSTVEDGEIFRYLQIRSEAEKLIFKNSHL